MKTVILKDFQSLKKESLKVTQYQVFLLYSHDHLVVEEVYGFIHKTLSEKEPNIENVTLNGLETDASIFHAELSTIPMFQNCRVLFIRHADTILKKIDANKTILSYFLRDFKNLPDTTKLILQIDDKKIPASLKTLEENTLIYKTDDIREKDLPFFLKSRSQIMGYSIDDIALKILIEKCAWDYSQAIQALDRLFTYAVHEKKISTEDVHEVCHDMEGDVYFMILDSLSERKIKQCVKLLIHHKLNYGDFIVQGIIKLFTNALRYSYLRNNNNLSTNEIFKRLEIKTNHAFILKKNENQFQKLLSKYNAKEISDILEKLFELDKRFKENTRLEEQKTFLITFAASLENKVSLPLN
ncbi:MAG: hypothetical protein OEZ22_03165 [Spirochaetia bacterium]|nr:hypothetical protein [Spirochaetia bacterium]